MEGPSEEKTKTGGGNTAESSRTLIHATKRERKERSTILDDVYCLFWEKISHEVS